MLGYFLAILVGLSLGLLGGGGSILTVPILVYALGLEAKLAIAMSLAIVGITSLIGAVGHYRNKNINLPAVFAFAPAAMTGSFLGAKSTVYMTPDFQMLLFAIVMLTASVLMVKKSFSGLNYEEVQTKKLKLWLIALQALAVGGLSGIIGVGGGFLIVPALVILAGLSMKEAIGSSLLIIALNSATGFAGYVGLLDIPWGFLLKFTAFSGGGILLGSYLVPHVPQQRLKQGFSVFLLIMGIVVLYKNLG